MKRWQPPIPKGAFVEAQALGAGLVLLGYCYDIVKAGGLIEVNLHELYPVLGTSYASIRRWWGMMQKMGIIERAEERGRSGVRAYFSQEWIDWRQPETRSPISAKQETSSPVSANKDEMRSEMRSESSSPVSAKGSAYKVLNNTDQAESHGGSEDQDRTRRTHPPAVALLFEIFPEATISREQGDDVCSTVTDLALWREVLVTWKANGYKPRIGNLLDRYLKDSAKREHDAIQPHRNGRKQYTPPTPEWTGWTETDLDKPL